uniref:NADH-ubiquinone oxidoreductase chain 5 n=1 Tax=Halocynthia spinosa TaxID=569430 RepID=S0DG90_HALSF|nr:NADH dehydrogenase subunit 5 [Halocynthia spinosa]CCO25777.1 NADH dehydrogenase subunit 5 [Halocynthia spinosa]
MISVVLVYGAFGLLGVFLVGQLCVVLGLMVFGTGLGGVYKQLVLVFYKGMVLMLLLVIFFSFFVLGGEGVGVISVGGGWLGIKLEFLLDFYTCLFFLVGGYVSWSIVDFSFGYMGGEVGYGKFCWLLLLFLFFMMWLVVSGNFLMLFVGWEGVGLLSFLLISWWLQRSEAIGSGLQAVLYNRVGDFGVMVWMCSMFFSGVGLCEDDSFFVLSGSVFLFFGIIAKSSQFFFHPWLPNAMEGPTPVSSLLHSSTMVVAGVFLLIRVVSFFDGSWLILLFGSVTAFWGGVCAVFQVDFKKIVAFSTTSQLGFMMFSVGLGMEILAFFHMMVHAFFKALIFMVSGEVIHGSQNYQDVRKVNGFVGVSNTMGMLLLFSVFSMMGFPFLSGFVSKDILLECLFGGFFNRWVVFLFFVSAVLTCVYSGGLLVSVCGPLVFFGTKIMGGSRVWGLFFLYRLFVGVVVVGLFLLGTVFTFSEEVLFFFLKLVPLVVFFVGICLGFFAVGLSSSVVRAYGFFLGFYNPLSHKCALWVSFFYSHFLLVFDGKVFEEMGPQGIRKVWTGLFFLVYVLFSIFLFIFCLYSIATSGVEYSSLGPYICGE